MSSEALILNWRKNDGGTMPLASVRVVEGYGVKTLLEAELAGDAVLRRNMASLLLQLAEDMLATGEADSGR